MNMILMAFVMERNRGVTSKEPPRILPAPSTVSDPQAPGLLCLPTEEKKGQTPSSTFQGAPIRGPYGGGRGGDRTPLCAGIQQGRD